MIVTIHQPEHLPWLGFIHKASMADVLVLLDNVQYRKNYYQNRNKIRSVSGFSWITVPVQKHPLNSLINEIKIDTTNQWQKRCWKTLYFNYKKAAYFAEHSGFFEEIYSQSWDLLVTLNIKIIQYMLKAFNIPAKSIRASSMKDISGKRDSLLLSICQKLGAQEYLSGISGKEYLDIEKFEQAGVKVTFQNFFHPIYEQCYSPFIPCMSAIDLLFNYGDNAKEILLGPEVPRLNYLME
jgi:hypothetical protein